MIFDMQWQRFIAGRSQAGRVMRVLLALMLLIALWHVSQHRAQDYIGSDTGDCQVCRLAHAPAAGGASPIALIVIFMFARLVAVSHIPLPRSITYVPFLARGPPSA